MGTPGVKLKLEAVERAIRECHGVLSQAAEALGCNRFTLYRWIEREPHLKQVREEAGEILLDIAERNVVRGLEEGSASYTKWFLDRKGRSRGYGPRSEILDDGPGRGAVLYPVPPDLDLDRVEVARAVFRRLKAMGAMGKPVTAGEMLPAAASARLARAVAESDGEVPAAPIDPPLP
jgi:hypothetical protein